MISLERLTQLADYVAGAADTPPSGIAIRPGSWTWAVWWSVLGLLIILFCGQTTKFIYIDF